MSMGTYRLNPCVVFAGLLCVSITGCTSPAQPVASQHEYRDQRSERASVACPSTDFSTFLQRYADVANDDVRRRFTDDPLEYEVPTHTVEEETESSPITHISKQTGPSRLELFSYRYFKDAEVFDQMAAGRSKPEPKSKVGSPVSIELTAGEGRRVSFGMEYEVDTYIFERRQGCWYLTRAVNLRD
ncbi:hypothetical protein ACCQ05_02835 [Xanthomonas sp. NCPPB 3582]|uniref:hypothetical protein n=1 Tax=Xanthomonas sp. NCPPB 3582 TaxID=487557 RepID=UPI0035568481